MKSDNFEKISKDLEPELPTVSPLISSNTLAEYDQWTIRERIDTKLMKLEAQVDYNILCLSSESGEVSDARKRFLRGDYKDARDYREDILLELGDVLHYVCRIAADHGFTIQEALEANVEKLTNRKKHGKGNLGKRS